MTKSRGRIRNDISKLTPTTTKSGSIAMPTDGVASLRFHEISLRDRTHARLYAFANELVVGDRLGGDIGLSPKPSPALRAESARPSHHNPNANMIADAIIPNPGAANGVVQKGIEIVF